MIYIWRGGRVFIILQMVGGFKTDWYYTVCVSSYLSLDTPTTVVVGEFPEEKNITIAMKNK